MIDPSLRRHHHDLQAARLYGPGNSAPRQQLPGSALLLHHRSLLPGRPQERTPLAAPEASSVLQLLQSSSGSGGGRLPLSLSLLNLLLNAATAATAVAAAAAADATGFPTRVLLLLRLPSLRLPLFPSSSPSPSPPSTSFSEPLRALPGLLFSLNWFCPFSEVPTVELPVLPPWILPLPLFPPTRLFLSNTLHTDTQTHRRAQTHLLLFTPSLSLLFLYPLYRLSTMCPSPILSVCLSLPSANRERALRGHLS